MGYKEEKMANWVHFPIQTDDGGEVWVTMDNEAPDFLERLDRLRENINKREWHYPDELPDEDNQKGKRK